ncbi:MAG: fatty acid desaturase [Parvularculaceae bacterium]
MPDNALLGERARLAPHDISENKGPTVPAPPLRAPATALRVGSPKEWLSADDRAVILDQNYKTCLTIFVACAAFYCLTLIGALAPLPLVLNLVSAVANGLAITHLFIIGHDCMHDAFAPSRKANRMLGRLAFIPCAFSPSLWIEGHNIHHHGKTNLRGCDFAWTPMDPESFAKAPPLRRQLERIYRSPFGHGLYTFIEVWLKRLILPVAPEFREKWRRHAPDGLFVVAALALTVGGVFVLGDAMTPNRSLLAIFLIGWLIPFAVWCHVFGLSTYLQHTHPGVRWFDDPAEWSFYRAAILATTDVDMSTKSLGLINDAMAHTVHHALPSVPVYRLKQAQEKLSARYRDDIISFRFTFREYWRVLKACKLYNYKEHYWTDFDGRQTGPSLAFEAAPVLAPVAADAA